MAKTLYTRDILRLASQLEPDISLSQSGNIIGYAEKNAPICGSNASVSVILDDHGQITEAAFTINSCAMGQASAALLIEYMRGLNKLQVTQMRDTLQERLRGVYRDVTAYPKLSVFDSAAEYSARHGAILLPYETLISAIENMGA